MNSQGFPPDDALHSSSGVSRDRGIEPILRLEGVNLRGSIGSELLLNNLDCEIYSGETVALVGASGSGKTSLLRLLNGLVAAQEGTVYLENLPFESYAPVELRRRLVLLPQEPKLLGMTVIESLRYPLILQQLPETELKIRIEDVLQLLRIPTEWLTRSELQLSLGQRQLVAIARALVMRPQVLLLDEPTSALDVGVAANLLEVLQRLNRAKLTIIMVNHQLNLLENFCDRLLFLEHGTLTFEASPPTPHDWRRVSQRILQLQSEETAEWS